MAFQPSSRRHYEIEEPELNLNPMMDMFGVLIPALLMMTAVVEVATLNVVAPAIGSDSSAVKPPTEPPLNLTVAIREDGYSVESALPGAFADISGANGQAIPIPITKSNIICSRYRGTVPPPRDKNQSEGVCTKEQARLERPFWLYNRAKLADIVSQIKDRFPNENRIILQPGPTAEYEALIEAMDTTRDIRLPSGETRVLFDEVVISPGS